jgi:endogenous inhibitor of DNA gyrase (YacG/DUF329 family)
MTSARIVRCPHCGKTFEWSAESPFRPFCSPRCKDIDFGAWASERYRIPAVEEDEEDGAPKPERD